ncbi:hypothetical protein JWG42_14900 [Desulfoprunum benzoelyticum]|uniref:Uncharacterized protein n=1 Tax=Desulfoprunum benzoelyticum TaxID=1506996 RepID=A0A840UNE4_9BACT|nr:hypothetical protein [Desulfoprunum benzoelyticum]MBB5347292.1 hypothetical protein [Desulfoprunum benzoelyticum]MBM9531446.1 hypothetical protein [Desulfoprunum benzoelyticum]
MNKLLYLLVVLCGVLAVPPAFADEWEGLTLQERERVQLQSREMSELGIPETPARQMLITMHRNRFSEQNMARARQMVLDAARAGLPTEAMMNEAMTGMARQAREQEVVTAMATVRNRYDYADRMAKSLATEPRRTETMRTAIVDCLATGMRPADLEAVRDRLQVRSQARQRTQNRAEDEALAVQTMLTVATMSRRGVRSPEVADIVGRALQQQYTYREMEQLRQRFANRAVAEAPRAIAARHAASIGRGDGPGPTAGAGAGGGNAGSGNSGGGNAGGSGGSGNSGSGNSGGGNAGGGNGGGGHGGGR